MHIRNYVFIVCALFFVGFLIIFQHADHTCIFNKSRVCPADILLQKAAESPELLQYTLKEQRNALSYELNKLRQRLGRMDCETVKGKAVNEAGGWCRNSSKEGFGEHMTDMKLVKALSTFFRGKSVGSFGDGPGAYKREILKLSEVKLYDAYDGAPFCEETSEGRVAFLDLIVPQYGLPIYDWIISLEVAEHIPNKSEAIYIDNLVRHSKEGIVLSWAAPGQGGLAHINNRPHEYVVKLMEDHGFSLDKDSSQKLRSSASFQWLIANTNVYRRKNKTHVSVLESWYS